VKGVKVFIEGYPLITQIKRQAVERIYSEEIVDAPEYRGDV
jgi:hypothetical protein